ncbi:Subtilase family protein [Amycolatopsis xylanica]|uniref:Subtilase family protein n=1 Tax=Amycolatopsis xylanica TaxID=589385 RepID=A0A1H3AJU0_9PSEU|nr:S8 family serine peptidase [Amycolatopsis xylanica]SDX29946.1 Subtilase family protein [Amycolatopsis xylanica]
MRKLVLLGLMSLFVLSATPAYATGGYWVDQLGLRQAWQLSKGDGVRVGLIDTGVTKQSELVNVLPGADFPDLGAPPGDAIGHGTTMALLIAGVAPKAGILPAKLTGGAADAVAAVRWAVDSGATVVNISLGAAPGETDYDEAITYAREHDVVVVAAAGNAPRDTRVTSPADRPGVLAISAVDRTGQFSADVSVSGTEVSFAAPGVDITTARTGEKAPTSGTSQAAAIVSGVVALVRSRFPGLTAGQVTEVLAKTAKDLGAPGRDPLYGFGLVDPVAALNADVDETNWRSIVLWVSAGIVSAGLGIWLSGRLRGRGRVRP